jgi:MEMO1 family protein
VPENSGNAPPKVEIMSMTIRQAAVAGSFYPNDAKVLRAEVHYYTPASEAQVPALGCIVPHAGYIYSGHVAGAVYAMLDLPRRYLVLCPNHTGMGRPLAIMSEGGWQTPLGTARIDASVAAALKRDFPLLQEDTEAHRSEHGVEVQLPFLQVFQPGLSFVPITLGIRQFDLLAALGSSIARVIEAEDSPVLIVASSDMNHYENDRITREKDHKAIDRVLALDAQGLFDVVMKEGISMCGYGPAVVMLTAAKQLGAKSAQLVRYATSGDISGDRDKVVGYAGVVVQ